MNKAFRYRIYPNKEQEILIQKTFGCCRFVYNKMLADKILYFHETGKSLSNTPAQYKTEFPFLKEVDSLALANVQINLKSAYKNFFRDKKVGFPKFKSKKHNKKSYTTNNQHGTVGINGNHIRLPKVGLVKIVLHRRIPENYIIKSATVTQTSSGKYYVSILTYYEPQRHNIVLDKKNSLGLDYSSHEFYVDNQNNRADVPHFFRLAEDKLAKEQRKLSHMVKGSNNYNKQKIVVAGLHEKVANQRKDWIEKLSCNLSESYDYVFVEDINLQSMSQCLKLGKSTFDNGFGLFRQRLSDKLLERGKQLVIIDKWYPSSKTCHVCGCINKSLKLSDRIWACPDCGEILDRDYNAAINIREIGILSI